MTADEFKLDGACYRAKETSACQEHFNDFCARLGQPTPAAGGPSGNEFFCFQRGVVKDAELPADTEAGPDEGDSHWRRRVNKFRMGMHASRVAGSPGNSRWRQPKTSLNPPGDDDGYGARKATAADGSLTTRKPTL